MAIASNVFTEKFVQMTHGKTRYWEAGSGYPTILIHGAGWTSGCENWAGSIGPLSGKLRVLAMDCLNWGLGDVLDQEFSFAYLVDHVREFMDVLGIEKANFVGHSMGGWIVTLLSYESPNRCNRVVNVAGGGAAVRPLQNMVEFKVPSADQIRQQLSHRAPAGGLSAEDQAAAFIKKIDLPGHGEAFAKVMRHMTNPITRQRYNIVRRLPYITAPTLVVWGSNDRVNQLDESGRPIAEGIPGAKLIVYEGIGHAVPQENPEAFNRDVLAFLTA
ncbi:MAG TPA: alpha/beta hydrolase [Chloroflexota bacterium]|nr:alpha/beta hydrolase [Chloroflexota bacterium]